MNVRGIGLTGNIAKKRQYTNDGFPFYRKNPNICFASNNKSNLAPVCNTFKRVGALFTLVSAWSLSQASFLQSAEALSDTEIVQEFKSIKKPSVNNGWYPSVKVLASCGEDFRTPLTSEGGFYTKALEQKLRQNKVKGLIEAHNSMEKEGYHVKGKENGTGKNLNHIYYPVSTLSENNCWKKNDKNKKRAVLLINPMVPKALFRDLEARSVYTSAFKTNIDIMESLLKDIYNLADEKIKRLDNASAEIIIESIRTILSDPANDEVLIYYGGHGDAIESWGNNNEGDAEGVLLCPMLDEATLKEEINGLLENLSLQMREKTPNILMIFDSCHSGALIANQNKLSNRNTAFYA